MLLPQIQEQGARHHSKKVHLLHACVRECMHAYASAPVCIICAFECAAPLEDALVLVPLGACGGEHLPPGSLKAPLAMPLAIQELSRKGIAIGKDLFPIAVGLPPHQLPLVN